MTMGGNEAQPVRLIAVDSEGIPVTDPQILQAAAEQAGIMFVSKDENDEENSITIDQAMQVIPTTFFYPGIPKIKHFAFERHFPEK